MNVEVQCAICGKREKIEIDDKTKKILGDWGYWGKMKFPDGKEIEYWECPKCLKKRK